MDGQAEDRTEGKPAAGRPRRHKVEKPRQMFFVVKLDGEMPGEVPEYGVYRVYTERRVGTPPVLVEEALATARGFSRLWHDLQGLRGRTADPGRVAVYAADSEYELSSPRRGRDMRQFVDVARRLRERWGQYTLDECISRLYRKRGHGRPIGFSAGTCEESKRILGRIVEGSEVKGAIEGEIGRPVEIYEWPHKLYRKLQRYCKAAYDLWILTGEPDLAGGQPIVSKVANEFWRWLRLGLPSDSKLAAKAVEMHYEAITSGERKDEAQLKERRAPPPPKPSWVD